MKKIYLLLLLLLTLQFPLSMIAQDIPYRFQRREVFRVLPTNEESIVFLGNSITNFALWHEIFGNDPRIVNRGISGNISGEVLEHLDLIVAGKPKKIFLMIGINDFQNEEVVVPNTRRIIEVVRKESPSTEIYIQSLLPCNRADRHGMVEPVNEDLKKLCAEMDVPYIDVYSKIVNKNTTPPSIAQQYTNDNLHVVASGYREWTKDFAQYVGIEPVFADGNNVYDNGLVAFENIMLSQFCMLPVNEGDILMLGDYNVQVGEWHELLRSSKVRNRGIGIGYGYSLTVSKLRKVVPHAIKGNPSRVFVQCGARDMLGKGNVDAVFADYQLAIENIKTLAPNADIYVQSLIPSADNSINTDYIIPFNEKIKALADASEDDKVHFVDVYSALAADGVLAPDFQGANTAQSKGINGRGYLRWANVLAPFCGEDVNPVPEMSDARFALNDALSATRRILFNVEADGAPGTYSEEGLAALRIVHDAATAVFASADATDTMYAEQTDKLEAAMTELSKTIVLPKASTADESFYYYLSTPLRGNRYPTAQGAGAEILGLTEVSNDAVWKFVERQDGTFDIVNYANNLYISPASAQNSALRTQTTSPDKGWELKPADSQGLFIIVSGSAQFNQTNTANLGFKVYNWGGGTNTNDTGCQYRITEVEESDIPEEPEPVDVPEPVLVLTDANFGETMPYCLNADEAAKVFALDSYTVALDVTMDAAINGRGAFVCAADPKQPVATAATPTQTPYFALGHNGTKLAHLASSKAGDVFSAKGAVLAGSTNVKVVYTVDKTATATGTLRFYANGVLDIHYAYPLAGYELPVFSEMKSNHPDANIYIGGGMVNDAAYELCKGDIKSVRFYDTVLTAEQVAAIDYTDNPETSIASVGGNSKPFVVANGSIAVEEGANAVLVDVSGRSFRLGETLPTGIYVLSVDGTSYKIVME